MLDAIVFRAFGVTVVYSPGRDVFAFRGSLEQGAPTLARPPIAKDAGASEPPGRRTLRLLRPTGDANALYGELPVSELTYPDFAAALDDFLDALAQARSGERIAEERFAAASDLPADDLIWIRG